MLNGFIQEDDESGFSDNFNNQKVIKDEPKQRPSSKKGGLAEELKPPPLEVAQETDEYEDEFAQETKSNGSEKVGESNPTEEENQESENQKINI